MLDVIILSNAKTPALQEMTKNTVQTLMQSHSELIVYIVEQSPDVYHDYPKVATIRIDEPFNYNRFANLAASVGTSEYICIANNDLVFSHPNWFREILKANHPVCSPVCPSDKRQHGILQNECGDQVGRHLSGWCFVIKRSLWEQIGGFDEDFSFWCADNSLMEQLIAIDIEPMVVATSFVEHLGSQTLKLADNKDELTRDQVRKYNRKYSKNLFGWGT